MGPAVTGGPAATESPAAATESPAAAERPARVRADLDFEEMFGELPDADAFCAGIDELKKLAEAGDAQGACALFDSLDGQIVHIQTLRMVAGVHRDLDMTDEDWQEKYSECAALNKELYDALCQAGQALLNSPIAEAFAAYIGPDAAEEIRDSVPLNDEALEQMAAELQPREEAAA